MRVHAFLFGATLTTVAAMATVQACGGDTGSTGTATDAGNDTSKTDAPADTAQPPVDSGTDTAPACDLDADFVTKIPDADIADGLSTTGICAGCVEAKCKAEVNACNQDCKCAGVADKVLVCYAESGGDTNKLIACALAAGVGAGALTKTSTNLLGCVQDKCPVECPNPTDAGLDGD